MSRHEEEQALLEATFVAMSRKLHANNHKPSWRDSMTPEDLMDRLREEVDELDEAVLRTQNLAFDMDGWESAWAAVIDEAADVANFAGMVIDTAHEEADIPRPPEGDRWRDRIKLVERRARRATAILCGRRDPYPQDDD